MNSFDDETLIRFRASLRKNDRIEYCETRRYDVGNEHGFLFGLPEDVFSPGERRIITIQIPYKYSLFSGSNWPSGAWSPSWKKAGSPSGWIQITDKRIVFCFLPTKPQEDHGLHYITYPLDLVRRVEIMETQITFACDDGEIRESGWRTKLVSAARPFFGCLETYKQTYPDEFQFALVDHG